MDISRYIDFAKEPFKDMTPRFKSGAIILAVMIFINTILYIGQNVGSSLADSGLDNEVALVGGIVSFTSAILSIIPGLWVYGYFAKTLERLRKNPEEKLESLMQPSFEWSNLTEGFKLAVSVVYIPVAVFLLLTGITLGITIFATGVGVADGIGLQILAPLLIFLVPLICLAAVAILAYSICVQPAIVKIYLDKGFSSTFDIKLVHKETKENFKNIVLYSLVNMAATALFSLATMIASLLILFCVGLVLVPVVMFFGYIYQIFVKAKLFNDTIYVQ